MNYTDDYGSYIKVGNVKPRKLQGGLIPENSKSYHPQKIPFVRELIDRDADTVSSLLPAGSVVIPRTLVKLVNDNFTINKSHFFRNQTLADSTRLVPVIVQPNELIVPKSQSKQVLNFLRTKGYDLPLKKDSIF